MDNNINFDQGEMVNQVDPSSLPDMVCKNCKNKFFKNHFKFKYSSGITSGTGEPGVYTIPAWVCTACGLELDMENGNYELIYNDDSEQGSIKNKE